MKKILYCSYIIMIYMIIIFSVFYIILGLVSFPLWLMNKYHDLTSDILSSMNETRFYILRLSYWITLTYVGYALASFNFILRTWLSFFITFMILCYKDFCGNPYQNIKEHNKYTT